MSVGPWDCVVAVGGRERGRADCAIWNCHDATDDGGCGLPLHEARVAKEGRKKEGRGWIDG